MKLKKYIFLIFAICIIALLLKIFFALFDFSVETFTENTNAENKYCCIYAYYEKDDLYKDNFQHFLKHGGILNNVDYYIVINGNHTINIMNETKYNIKFFEKENKGYDFGAYSYVINRINKNYDYYIFLNATVKGPYLLDNTHNWLEIYLSLFNDNVKLVGASICYASGDAIGLKKYNLNTGNIYYVQTPFFIIKNDFLNHLKDTNFFLENELNDITDLEYVVMNKEIKLSYLCYLFGGNINCYLEKYRNLDYRTLKYDINKSSVGGDAYFENAYFCGTIQPTDVIFYKNKRFLQDTLVHKDILETHRNEVFNKVCLV
jgi:hypothetical protein